jgi:hypothetical protein
MATKKQIAEQALLILSGGHLKPDRTIDIREVMFNLDQVRDELVRESTKAAIKEGIIEVDHDYLSFYESVSVSTDATKGLSYITLPASVISLPLGLGIYQITPIDDMEDAYIITRPGAPGLYSGTPALERTSNTYCWPVGDRVYFKNLGGAVSDVTVLMAATSKDIAESADFPVPPDEENLLLKNLLATFGVEMQAPHDEMEDGQK